MSVSFEDVKERYSVQSFFENVMGATPKIVSGQLRFGVCPACGVASKSSVKCSVREPRWRCFACLKKGDVIDAAAEYWGYSQAEAASALAEESPMPSSGRAKFKAPPVSVKNYEAIAEVIERLIAAQTEPDAALFSYVNSRGISDAVLLEGIERKLVVTLPGDPGDAMSYLHKAVGDDLLRSSGIWKEGSKTPAICYRPLGFVSDGAKSIEFKLIAANEVAIAKSLRYGDPLPSTWTQADDELMFVEGGVDMLSAICMGSIRTIISIPGTTNIPTATEWVESFSQKFALVAFDDDDAGRVGASSLRGILQSVGCKVARYRHREGCTDLNDELKVMHGLWQPQ